MFSAIFEIFPKRERFDEYLALAKHLKPILEKVDGFVDNERFESRGRPGWILSHSTWRDEKSLVRWRTTGEHYVIQKRGRFEIFQDYHLRIGDVIADTDPPKEAPIDEKRFDETEIGVGKFVTLTEALPQQGTTFGSLTELAPSLGLDLNRSGVVDHDVFTSIYNPGKLALLVTWRNAQNAKDWTPTWTEKIRPLRHRIVRIVRVSAKFDRREAPQFFPDAEGRDTIHSEPAR
jgi:heme-degrading monooxygenase HmoA